LYRILFDALVDKAFAFLGHPPELLSIRGSDVFPYLMERFVETSNDLATIAAGRSPANRFRLDYGDVHSFLGQLKCG
jgi:hypothetical protein